VAAQLSALGLRVGSDDRDEKIGFKIREAEMLRVPYMLVVGGREMAADTVAVRARKQGDLGSRPVAELGQQLLDVVASKT